MNRRRIFELLALLAPAAACADVAAPAGMPPLLLKWEPDQTPDTMTFLPPQALEGLDGAQAKAVCAAYDRAPMQYGVTVTIDSAPDREDVLRSVQRCMAIARA